MNVVRIVLSFAAVGGLLWLFARAGRGRFGALLTGAVGSAPAAPLEILERRQLSRNAGVAVVRAGTRHLLIGVGETGVQLLTEGDDLVADPAIDRRSGSNGAPSTDAAPNPDQNLGVGIGVDSGSNDSGIIDLQSARTRLPRASTPSRPRMSFVDALREKTVRRS